MVFWQCGLSEVFVTSFFSDAFLSVPSRSALIFLIPEFGGSVSSGCYSAVQNAF